MTETTCRYFNTYSGVKLPLNLLSELTEAEIANRNTFFRAQFDAENRLVCCEKIVYGDVELKHSYEYYDSGVLKQAEITDSDGDVNLLDFDEEGQMV